MRRRAWLWRAAAVLAATLLMTMLTARGIPAPALTLVVVTAVGLGAGPVEGALTGLLGGWMADLVPPGGDTLGLAALTCAAAGYLAGRATRVSGWPLWWPGAVVAAGWGVVTGATVLRALTVGAPVAWSTLVVNLVLTVAAAVVLAPVLLLVDRRVAGRRAR